MASDILCLGEPMVEFVREPDGRFRQGFGGDTSNAAIAAARQGASVGYLGALGADRFGDAVAALWGREGVSDAAVRRDPTAPTGIYFVEPDPAARHFTYYRRDSAASLYGPKDIDAAALAAAKVLHLSGITLAVSPTLRAAGFAAMEAARKAGAAVSLDTNLRLALWPVEEAREVLTRAARLANVIVTSLDDCAALMKLDDADAVIDAFRTLGPTTVIVTMGGEGCRIASGARRESIPPFAAEPVDSTGAGDSFAGSFHAWALETGDPFVAARRAAVVAAGTVSGYGAIDPIPKRAAVLTALGETAPRF